MSRIVGIDLGTSTSEIAYIKDGRPELIPNHLGEYITPSVVHIEENGNVIVGISARERLLTHPTCTFMEVKRLLGSGITLEAHGRKYEPEEVISYIVKYLLECAQDFLKEKVERAVITVPAYFTDEQRRATVRAGTLAGITVERIINEPTAASLDYGLDHLSECKNILVYDLGGGTLDVTALELFEGIVDVKASSGNSQLGGRDFDEAIMNLIIAEFKERHGTDVTQDVRAVMRLKKEAEACKIALSTESSYTIELPFFANVDDEPVALVRTISRKEFESLLSTKIDETKNQINAALSDGKMPIGSLDMILLVGGSTRIPYVETFITNILGRSPAKLVDPDLAVVRGAAIQAGIMENEIENDKLIITDVCPFTLSTAVLTYQMMMPQIVCDPIIHRNTTIPVTRTKNYVTSCDEQTEVIVKVYQGESKLPENNNFLNQFRLSGIPEAPAGEEQISVGFSYDINGLLVVTAKVASTGESASIEIDSSGIRGIETDVSQWQESKLSKKYRAIIKRAEKVAAAYGSPELDDAVYKLKEAIVLEQDKTELERLKELIMDMIYEMEADNDDE